MKTLDKLWTDVKGSFKGHERRIGVAKSNHTHFIWKQQSKKKTPIQFQKLKIVEKYEIRRGLSGE